MDLYRKELLLRTKRNDLCLWCGQVSNLIDNLEVACHFVVQVVATPK